MEAERRRFVKQGKEIPKELTGIRKVRKAKRTLTLKPAPLAPTAPKSAFERKKAWVLGELKKHLARLDYWVIGAIVVLSVIGIFAVISATASTHSIRNNVVQVLATGMGLALMMLLSFLDYRTLLKYYKWILVANIILLALTYFFGQGLQNSDTNRNWLNLGPIKIQPSEFAKPLFIMSFAAHLGIVKDHINSLKTAAGIFIHGAGILGLVMLQKDMGTAAVFLFIFVSMCFAAKLSLWYFLAGGLAGIAVMPMIWERLGEYQRKRIMVCFDPSIDPEGLGIRYQQAQSAAAIGLGGVTGTGYGKGVITQSNRLPAKHTDMIFSTICEEAGLIGALIILVIFAVLILKLLHTGAHAENPSGTYICAGIAGMLIFQVVGNIGMCLGVLPVIGITLPFVSYGGSSVLSLYLTMGLALSVYARKDPYFFTAP